MLGNRALLRLDPAFAHAEPPSSGLCHGRSSYAGSWQVLLVDSLVQVFSVFMIFVCRSISYWRRGIDISNYTIVLFMTHFRSVSFCFVYFEAVTWVHGSLAGFMSSWWIDMSSFIKWLLLWSEVYLVSSGLSPEIYVVAFPCSCLGFLVTHDGWVTEVSV